MLRRVIERALGYGLGYALGRVLYNLVWYGLVGLAGLWAYHHPDTVRGWVVDGFTWGRSVISPLLH